MQPRIGVHYTAGPAVPQVHQTLVDVRHERRHGETPQLNTLQSHVGRHKRRLHLAIPPRQLGAPRGGGQQVAHGDRAAAERWHDAEGETAGGLRVVGRGG